MASRPPRPTLNLEGSLVKYQVIETELIGPGSGQERSEGLHLTPIIRDIAVELGIFKSREGDDGPPPALAEMGFMFEDLLAKVFGDRLMAARIGEVELDGITGSPDGMNFHMVDMETVVEEYKCTWKSMNRPIEDEWYWITQTKAYCKMTGCRRAILRVMYVNGDYKPPTPAYRAYDLKFTERELEENWRMIVNHARAKGWLK